MRSTQPADPAARFIVRAGRTGERRLAGWLAALMCAGAAGAIAFASVLAVPKPAGAAGGPVDLGTAATYSVLAGSTVTNTGPSVLDSDLGLSPGTDTPGFPPGLVLGAPHIADANALQAKSDLVTAWNGAGSPATSADVAGDLVGRTLTAGVYTAADSLALSGTLTLDAQGDPHSVFIFRVGSTLITASASRVLMTNGAQPCNVWWQVGSSATLGTGSSFIGTVMAMASVTVTTGVTVEGRAMARTGAVTLDTDRFINPGCDMSTPTSPAASATTATGSTGSTGATGATGSTGATGTSGGAGGTGGPATAGPTATGGVGATATSGGAGGSGKGSNARTEEALAPTTSEGTPTRSTGRATTSRSSTTQTVTRLAKTGNTMLRPLLIFSPLLLALGGLLLYVGRRRARARHG